MKQSVDQQNVPRWTKKKLYLHTKHKHLHKYQNILDNKKLEMFYSQHSDGDIFQST